jgi:hypothetical protein
LIDGSDLYTTTRDGLRSGHLFVIRLSDGRTLRHEIGTAGAPFAKRGDTVYVGGGPPLAWDAREERTVWRASSDADDDTAPATMIADGALDDEQHLVFTADSQRFVYVLASGTGILRRRIRLDHHPRFELTRPLKALYGSYGARRLQVHRGMLFVGTVDGSLFVFRIQ